VAIIGGGGVGAELGLYLAESKGRTVMLVEMKDEKYPVRSDKVIKSTAFCDVPEYPIGDPVNYRHGIPLFERLEKSSNFSYKVGTKCVEITPKGIKVAGKDGKEEFIEADTVIYAVGMKPNSDTVKKLRDSAMNFYPIGDCVKAQKITQATQGGYFAALDIR
jgi:Pyruvate/2-oxoglutarate dehydrogenase complex, dihydrolipoamide dehydrogenase (E3) component, and related enzymes